MSALNPMQQRKDETARPWYRQTWPWIIIAGPATVVVASIITAYVAFSTSDGLVADDYYKQGLAVNQVSVRNQHADALGLQADLVRGDDGALLRVFLRAKAATVFPPVLSLRITHPTRGGLDQSIVLRADGTGFYSGKLNSPLRGRWHVALEDDKGEWRLTGDWVIDQQSTLQLPSAVKAAGAIDLHPDSGRRSDKAAAPKP
jgi:hypothetical protein